MAHTSATIGTTDYAVAITAGHHQLRADEGPALGGKDTGPGPFELLCSALGACTAITLREWKSTCVFRAPARRAPSRACLSSTAIPAKNNAPGSPTLPSVRR